MNKRTSGKKLPLLSASLCFMIVLAFPSDVKPQALRFFSGEIATCTVTMQSVERVKGQSRKRSTGGRPYQVASNQLGYFDRIVGIQPRQTISLQIAYPQAEEGEKVIMIAADGGNFDDSKKVKVLQVDMQKKLSFNFHVADAPGNYRLFLRKGNDSKVVQLWVE